MLLREHHRVVGWVRLDPNGSEATWYAEQRWPTHYRHSPEMRLDDRHTLR